MLYCKNVIHQSYWPLQMDFGDEWFILRNPSHIIFDKIDLYYIMYTRYTLESN